MDRMTPTDRLAVTVLHVMTNDASNLLYRVASSYVRVARHGASCAPDMEITGRRMRLCACNIGR